MSKLSDPAAPHKPTTTIIARHKYITQTPQWQARDTLSQKNGPHATVFMVNGDRFLGEWKGNKKHGNGTYFYASTGSIYEGEWANDMRNGYGTFSVPLNKPKSTLAEDSLFASSNLSETAGSKKRKLKNPFENSTLRKVYAGEWRNDRREGYGTYFYEDGGVYDGMWMDDQREGWGKMHYVDGSTYEGEWHREMRHGQGILLLTNGDRYEGMWLDDQKEGPGKFIYKTKRQAYEGEWYRGLPKCGTLVDLPPLPGTMPRKYPIPELKLAAPKGDNAKKKSQITV
ncbi:hypothetical protein HDV05_006695 [Chytridiales sp. JEL 0842]|nr:hypothetical protein HDV05_006695 [Chytridiales sp. JEL 0842]